MSFLDKIQERFALIKFVSNNDQKNIDRVFTRVFQSEDGQKALAYLHHITTDRAISVDATQEQLRHLSGQRALVQTIQKLADRGRSIN